MSSSSFFDRDLSWLTFNCRVLEEAAREETPLLERIFFLSVYSSNLDEFYRVRIPAIAALQKIKATRDSYISEQGIRLLTRITSRLNSQFEHFGQVLTGKLLPALTAHGIHLVYHSPIPAAARQAATRYFHTQVLAFLQPITLAAGSGDFFPENDQIYFLVVLDQESPGEKLIALNIP